MPPPPPPAGLAPAPGAQARKRHARACLVLPRAALWCLRCLCCLSALRQPALLRLPCSTQTRPYKHVGRVGDSPLVGSGLYADSRPVLCAVLLVSSSPVLLAACACRSTVSAHLVSPRLRQRTSDWLRARDTSWGHEQALAALVTGVTSELLSSCSPCCSCSSCSLCSCNVCAAIPCSPIFSHFGLHRVGAAVATGDGEDIMRSCLRYRLRCPDRDSTYRSERREKTKDSVIGRELVCSSRREEEVASNDNKDDNNGHNDEESHEHQPKYPLGHGAT